MIINLSPEEIAEIISCVRATNNKFHQTEVLRPIEEKLSDKTNDLTPLLERLIVVNPPIIMISNYEGVCGYCKSEMVGHRHKDRDPKYHKDDCLWVVLYKILYPEGGNSYVG